MKRQPYFALFVALFLLAGSNRLNAQLFEKAIRDKNLTEDFSLCALSTGGYVIGTQWVRNQLPYMTRYDSSGNKVWQIASASYPNSNASFHTVLETRQGNLLTIGGGMCSQENLISFTLFTPDGDHIWPFSWQPIIDWDQAKLVALYGDDHFLRYTEGKFQKWNVHNGTLIANINVANYKCSMMHPLLDTTVWAMGGVDGLFRLDLGDTSGVMTQILADTIAAMTAMSDNIVLALNKFGALYEVSSAGVIPVLTLDANSSNFRGMITLNNEIFILGYSPQPTGVLPTIWKYDSNYNLLGSTSFGADSWQNLKMAGYGNHFAVVGVEKIAGYPYYQTYFPYTIFKGFNTDLQSVSNPRDLSIDNVSYGQLTQSLYLDCPWGGDVYLVKSNSGFEVTVSNQGTEAVDHFILCGEYTSYSCNSLACGFIYPELFNQRFDSLNLQPGESVTLHPNFTGFDVYQFLPNELQHFNFYTIQPDNVLDYNYANNIYVSPDLSGTIAAKEVTGGRLACFPNPANDVLMIDGASISNRSATIEVFDAVGKKMFLDEIFIDSEGNAQIDVGQLLPGMYWFKMEGLSLKFVKR